jgi:hypothetical protein
VLVWIGQEVQALPRRLTWPARTAMAESHLRISDQDREGAAAAIREHFAAGRLDNDEVEERLQAVYAARTQGEPTCRRCR